jgi:hypothetical protein
VRPRAVTSLASLKEAELFESLAEGMGLLAEHASSVEASARALEPAQVRGAAPLRALAEEEAAKFLILLDAARCPRKPPGAVATHLKRFSNHLARGLYIEAYEGRPADLREVRKYVDLLRRSHYLDGPNDVDWIFRNSVLARREERLYVDLVEYEDGTTWFSPARLDDIHLLDWSTALRLVEAAERLGFATPLGLQRVADIWRGVDLDDSTHWATARDLNLQTVASLEDAGISDRATAADANLIVEHWLFPLYSLDMSPIEVSLEELRQLRESWAAGEWGA